MRLARLAGLAITLALGALAVGCSAAGKAPAASKDGPGATVVADVIACTQEADCKTGETCGQGFCQMKRCSSPSYASVPPLGKIGYAFVDRAYVIGSEDTQLQVVSPHATVTSLSTASAPLDIAGGNLTGSRPEVLAYVADGSNALAVRGADGTTKSIDLGFQGNRLATGDVDGDGIDDVLVAGAAGSYAVCNVLAGTCKQGTLGYPPDDVAIGDVDGDGLGELLFIGQKTLTIIDVDVAKITTQAVDVALTSMSAGDLDGDGKAEIIGLVDGGAFAAGSVHVFHMDGALVEAAQLSLGYSLSGNRALDVAFTRQDNLPAFAVLTDASTMKTFTFASNAIVAGSTASIAGARAKRLAVADVDGRSAVVRLKGAPTLEIGPPVPLAVLTLPPYSGAHSAGPSSATMGNTDETSTSTSMGSSQSTSTSLMLGGGISFPIGGKGGGAPTSGGATPPVEGAPGTPTETSSPLSASVGLHYYWTKTWARTVSNTKSASLSLSVGGSYTLSADPQVDGYNSGGVVLAGGCFHRYDYAVEDPAGVLGVAGDFSTVVPVGGETTLWSTSRYNALVDALGDGRLPKIDIAPKLGNVSSYPTTPTTLDGKPIPKVDNVFPSPPLTRTSDVGVVGFSLSASTSTTNTDASSTNESVSQSVQLSANISVVSLSAQYTVDHGSGLDESYSLTVGSSSSFSGQVSPVRDDPTTPANEASLYAYSFRPYVYRHHFTDAKGTPRAFYALTYVAGD